jgi:ribosomal-protein-alanine acetyltransferase
VNIRPATVADVPAMMALEVHAVTAAHWSVADYARLFAAGSQCVVLVLEEQEVEGFVVARGIGTEWELENIAVAGPARRHGRGTRLLAELLDRARQAGARNIFLEVRESNRAARSLYEKWAFVESGRRKAYYRDPDEDAVLYRFTFPAIPEK